MIGSALCTVLLFSLGPPQRRDKIVSVLQVMLPGPLISCYVCCVEGKLGTLSMILGFRTLPSPPICCDNFFKKLEELVCNHPPP